MAGTKRSAGNVHGGPDTTGVQLSYILQILAVDSNRELIGKRATSVHACPAVVDTGSLL